MDDFDDIISENFAVSGAEVLDEVRAWLATYIRVLDPGDLDLLVLWAAHTHVCRETYSTPRLLIDSPMPGSGKTTVLEHMQRLCVRPVQMAAVSSAALLTRMLDEAFPDVRTLLIDEADRALHPDKESVKDLLSVINSGYKVGGTRPVLVPVKGGGWEAKEMTTFSPVAMAGNAPALPDDTMARCIRVLLLPDLDGTVTESDWELIEAQAEALGARLASWADLARDEIRDSRPSLPDGVKARNREKWLPLKRVAVAAGEDWPKRVDELAVADLEQQKADREDGMIRERPAMILLRHLKSIFDDADEDFIPTSDLVAKLIRDHPDVWGKESSYGKDLTVQRFGRMLSQGFRINSTQETTGARLRGYRRDRFESAWNRLTPPSSGDRSDRSNRADCADPEHGSHEVNTSNGSPETPCPNYSSCSQANCHAFRACIRGVS
ncbi:DUF3631 domain-containing protein [Ammonicoccus fulvus]|uniref:DUF3631 domain-containing protein n=1 Tax=Ammonicoccus fulvus TaxID=3138240 RepID=A0ABZ3FNL4_9ACTN